MRNLYEPAINSCRLTRGRLITLAGGYAGDETCGAFILHSPVDGRMLRVMAASDGEWDHVSVSRGDRCPTWSEMEYVKRRFFEPDEIAVEFHVPPAKHINCHPYCLHLWRPHSMTIPLPPPILI
jgi:hypothetical protein